MLAAARYVEHRCDAIDLNLGCPQVVAFTGHYGSFLLDDADRPLVLSIVKTLADALSIPVFVKIRLLSTLEETVTLCNQLAEAGAALIAVHARHRVSLTDRNADARGGAAHLEQVAAIAETLPLDVRLIANGNVREHADVVSNLELTGADGIMSAEGLLDNPAIFSAEHHEKDRIALAMEYLDLIERHPAPMKCVIFHVRRIARKELLSYQRMEECCASTSAAEVRAVLEQCVRFRDGVETFE
jgi:tRNA-dihydrouridine synthase 1